MPRILTVAAAQLGPIQKSEGRDVAVARMVALMERAAKRGLLPVHHSDDFEIVVEHHVADAGVAPDNALGLVGGP